MDQKRPIEELILPRISKRTYPSHGELVEDGALVGQTDTDYFYWICPRCNYVLQAEPLRFDLIHGQDYVLRIGLYCLSCHLHELVKIGSTGWKGGTLNPGMLNYTVSRHPTHDPDIERVAPSVPPRAKLSRVGLTPKKRFTLMLQHGFRCYYCGRNPVEHGVTLVIDHMQPHAKGGSNGNDNYVPACEECNQGKGALDIIGQ